MPPHCPSGTLLAASPHRLSPSLRVVFDRKVLTAHHTVTLEPLTTELLRRTVRSIRPFNGDEVVLRVLRTEVERIHQDVLLRVQHTARRVDTQAFRVGRLDRPSDTTSTGINNLKWNFGVF